MNSGKMGQDEYPKSHTLLYIFVSLSICHSPFADDEWGAFNFI
jgi:hypothetical protein